MAKGALTAGWAAAFIAAAVGDTTTCTPQAPSLCGPDQGFAWWLVVCLATPVLLVWLPLMGCVTGVAFALADQAFDHVTSAKVGFGLHGLACAVVALWLLRSATAQQHVAADTGRGVRAAVPTSHGRPDTDWDLGRLGAASVGLVALLLAVLLAGRGMQARRARERLWTGEHPALRVWVAPDEVGDAVVFADDGARPDVLTANPVARLPLAWVPNEENDGDDERSDALVAASGQLLPAARWPGETDEEWDLATQASFGQAWRGEGDADNVEPFLPSGSEPEPAVLLGSLRDRGWAVLLTEDDVLRPAGPLRLHRPSPGSSAAGARLRLLARLPFGPWRTQAGDERHRGDDEDPLLPGVPVRPAQPGPIGLPMVAAGPVRMRAVGLCMLAGVPALLLLTGLGWYERGLAVLVGGRVLLGGTARLLEQVRLSHTHLQVVGSYRRHSVPWERLHGVRRDGSRLVIAWQPDVVAEVGPFKADGTDVSAEARAERLGAVMLTLRRRAFVDVAAGRPARSRPGPAWGLLAGYAALVGMALWAVAAT